MVNFTTLLPVIAGLLGVANAHARVYSLWVNDVDQGDGRTAYIRSPPNNSPVKDVSSLNIICNVQNVAAPSSVSVNAGDKVTFEWYHDSRNDDYIDASHKGPITVYISEASTDGAGAVWTKLAEEGFSDGKWAVDNLIANGGKHSLTLPASLAAGNYLLRAEIIALHEGETDFAVNPVRGAQFYPSCAQITVKSGGSAKPPGDFSFVGGYTTTDPGILFNMYTDVSSYPIPGPAVWNGDPVSPPQGSNSTIPVPTGDKGVPVTSLTSSTAIPIPTNSASVDLPIPTQSEKSVPTGKVPAKGNTVEKIRTKSIRTKNIPTKSIPTKSKTAISPVVQTEAPAVTTVPSAPATTLATKTRNPKTKTHVYIIPTKPTPKPKPKTPEEFRQCLAAANACIAQAQSSIGGVGNIEPCEEQRAACY